MEKYKEQSGGKAKGAYFRKTSVFMWDGLKYRYRRGGQVKIPVKVTLEPEP